MAGNHQKTQSDLPAIVWNDIVMQNCPIMANYHYVHDNLDGKVFGGTPNILCFGYFLKMEAFRSELLTGH